jgi:replicative DNA helicase
MNARDHRFERELPNNIAAEQAVIGAILSNNGVFDNVSALLEPGHFYEPIHQRMFAIISERIRAGKMVDGVVIVNFFPPETKVGDLNLYQYMYRLEAERLPLSQSVGHAELVYEAWTRREGIQTAEELMAAAFDLAPEKVFLTEAIPFEEKLSSMRAQAGGDKRSASDDYVSALQSAYQRGEVRGVPIALAEVAKVISEPCFEAGNLYGLLSSSGEGKTSLTIQLMLHALRKGHPVLFLSYDQSADQVMRQMVAQTYEIEARRQRDAKLLSEREFGVCLDFASWIGKLPFDVVKCTDQSAMQLVGTARTFIKRRSNGKVPLVVVDHIAAVKPEDRRADEGTKAKGIGQAFKAGAVATDAAWLVLNQRNSFGMRRDNPRPISMDLFGGDPAKTPFDAIFYLYRFLKFLEERKAVASTDSDWKKIDKIFPSAVRQDGEDIAEIGAIKVRFGSPHIRERLIFEARLTRYKSDQPAVDQAELIEGGF